jgi:UDP:flavonoid glycosyltransferase YjiC (YdhE family)
MNKKAFLQFGSGLGPLSRSLPIAEELIKDGYQIRYFGFENAKSSMENLGVFPLNEKFNIKDIKKRAGNVNYYSAEQFWDEIGYGDIEWVGKKVDELAFYVREFAPDIIVSDLGILSALSPEFYIFHSSL